MSDQYRVVCKHLGSVTDDTVRCPSCRGTVELKVFTCAVHGVCTIQKKAPGVASCAGCGDYVSGSMVRPAIVRPDRNRHHGPTILSPFNTDHGQTQAIRQRMTKRDKQEIDQQQVTRPTIIKESSSKTAITWAYGITTVPQRKDVLLPRTIESLANAGFDQPRLFVDGVNLSEGVEYEDQFGLPVTVRNGRIRTFGNWILALAELYIRNPMAHRFVVFQDDVLACSNLREYLNRVEYPSRGYLNLITYPVNAALAKGKGWHLSDQWGRGGQGLVFDRTTLITLLIHFDIVQRPISKGGKGWWRNIDGATSGALKKAGYREYCHNPSLIGHTGLSSTMGSRTQPEITAFRGESYDPLVLLSRR